MNKTNRTQKTRKGHDIPVPKRGEVLKLFKKAATHQDKSASRSPKK